MCKYRINSDLRILVELFRLLFSVTFRNYSHIDLLLRTSALEEIPVRCRLGLHAFDKDV